MTRKKSIHRMLVARLAIATFVIAALVAVAVVLAVRRDIDGLVTERAIAAAGQFKWSIIDQLDAPGLGDHKKIQATLDRVSSAPPARPGLGHFVVARILDNDFNPVAGVVDNSYPHLPAVTRFMERPVDRNLLREGALSHRMRRIEGATVVRVMFPITNSAHAVVAHGDVLFAVSKEALHDAWWRVARTTGVAVAIVLLTTLLLYPAIIRLVRRLAALSENLLDANLQVLGVLGSAIAKRDSDTDVHNYRVTIYSVHLAEALGIDKETIRSLMKGAFLHDVGKIGITDAILLKPGRLTEAEFTEMKKHVSHGRDIVSVSTWLRDGNPVVSGHHEKYDGTGYGDHLNGAGIPLIARIFAIADVFDALTSRRPYKAPLGYKETMEIMRQGRGRHFDPALIDAFDRIAPSLYEAYANRDDAKPREDLQKILERYFKADVAHFLD
jgi:HD-GYP domain-containing protein (c-di-GMP phosphodiesterase class II)